MNPDALKLTIYFGERDRVGGDFLADALSGIYARHRLQTSLVIRGVEGFGAKHRLRTDRLLTLSEDLPLVSVAVDTRARIQAALAEVTRLHFEGLVTLERAWMAEGLTELAQLPPRLHETTKLTVYVGRHTRAEGRSAHRAIVELLQRHGIAGATVLLGVDGTVHGVRRRAKFFGANVHVPLMVIAVGSGDQVAGSVPELRALVPGTPLTLERVVVCKRDGQLLVTLPELPQTDPAGRGIWQKLMVYAGEQASSDGHPLHDRLVRALREAGAAGATSLRGIWGYSGDHQPHGDSFWQLRRRVPMVTVLVDTPDRTRRWFELVDQLTAETGLVTSELIPAFRATGPSLEAGELEIAELY